MSASNRRHELILYATPRGELLDACNRYFHEVSERFGATSAQSYPAHVTLTGFFHRTTARRDEMIVEVEELLRDWGAVPAHAVAVQDLIVEDHWVGLPITSRWLVELTTDIVAGHHLGPEDDELRIKDWLHLSLAYGTPGNGLLRDHGALAIELVDSSLPVSWEVALWERAGGPTAPTWHRHTDLA